MPITDRNLKLGTRLIARYRKQSYTCEVVEVEGGKVYYRLVDGREFKSPSSAGTAITGKSCNGWAFWSLAMTETAPETQTVVEEGPLSRLAEEAPAGELTTGVYRLPNQKGAPEGQTRWYCRECRQGFLAPTGETPAACPSGHRGCED